MPLTLGTRLGLYEILMPIGAGGMGEVYKARDTRLQRIVAVKVSKEQLSERFEREARAIAQLITNVTGADVILARPKPAGDSAGTSHLVRTVRIRPGIQFRA